jgi:Ubiquinol-cytochrome C reductase hinge protein
VVITSYSPPFYFLDLLCLQSDDAEPVDPMKGMRKDCESHCTTTLDLWKGCVERIKHKPVEEGGNCDDWYMEALACIDHCVAPKISKVLMEQSKPKGK